MSSVCQGLKADGNPCSNKAKWSRQGKMYCGIHCKSMDGSRPITEKPEPMHIGFDSLVEEHRRIAHAQIYGLPPGAPIPKYQTIEERRRAAGYR